MFLLRKSQGTDLTGKQASGQRATGNWLMSGFCIKSTRNLYSPSEVVFYTIDRLRERDNPFDYETLAAVHRRFESGGESLLCYL
jgi:hypothetical protein